MALASQRQTIAALRPSSPEESASIRPLRVLMILPGISGGTGTFIKSLAAALNHSFPGRCAASLLLLRNQTLPPEDRAAFATVRTLGASVRTGWRRFYELPIDFFRLRRALGKEKPDLTFTIGTYSNVLCGLAAGGVPVVMSEHMNMSLRVRAARFGWIMRWFMRWVYPHHLIVCAAEGLTRDLEQSFGAARTRVIPNGIDIEQVRALAEADPGPLPTGEPYCIAVGRLTAQKDFSTLLRGYALACKEGLPLHLLLVGDGEEAESLRRLAGELGITGRVHFVGHRDNPYPLMKHAAFLALTSTWEGFAYVPLEAMALGVPCIATRSDGPAAIFQEGESGMLVEPGDAAALALAMKRMSQSDIHTDYAARARRRAAELTVERMAEAYFQLFQEEVARVSAGR